MIRTLFLRMQFFRGNDENVEKVQKMSKSQDTCIYWGRDKSWEELYMLIS